MSILREWLSIHSESICNDHRQTVVIYVKIGLINFVSAGSHVLFFLSRKLCKSVAGSSIRTFTYKQSNQLSRIEVVAMITIKWQMSMQHTQGQSISKQKSHTTRQSFINSMNERKTNSEVITNRITLLSNGKVKISKSLGNGGDDMYYWKCQNALKSDKNVAERAKWSLETIATHSRHFINRKFLYRQ